MTFDRAKRDSHPLMRQPQRCESCGYLHLPDESCRAPVTCACGSPAGVYYIDADNPDRECHACFRERTG